MKYPTSVDGYVVELYLRDDKSFTVEAISDVTPTLIQIGIGDIDDIPMTSSIVSAIVDNIPKIESVVLPTFIPTQYVKIVYPLTTLDVLKIYLTEGNTGITVGAYSAKPGFLPDDINLYRRKSVEKKKKIENGLVVIDEADELPEVDDGFHPLPTGDLDTVVDGFHEIPVEKRDMWEEDPRRMNRLSYLPIANILNTDTFPEELGGGRV